MYVTDYTLGTQMLNQLVREIRVALVWFWFSGVVTFGASRAWIVVRALVNQAGLTLEPLHVSMRRKFLAHVALAGIDLGHGHVIAGRRAMLPGTGIAINDGALGWMDGG